MLMKSILRCIFSLFFLSIHIGLSAQSPVEADSFKLTKLGTHYVFSADFNGAVIAITKALPRFTTTGLIGLKYFNSIDAIFDFDRNRLHTSRP